MGDDIKNIHAGSPDVVLDSKASTLIEDGFKIVIIEQT